MNLMRWHTTITDKESNMKTFNQFFEDLNKLMTTGLARATDPQTSKDAAKTVDASKMEKIVLEAIRGFPDGCISQEVECVLAQYRSSSITPRYKPLLKKGLIVDTGEKRPGFSGRSQRVMRAI
jgi:hypothetical protein